MWFALQLSLEEWNRVLAVNLTGPMLLAKHCAGPLAAAGGAIVNIGSTRAHMSEANTEACESVPARAILFD